MSVTNEGGIKFTKRIGVAGSLDGVYRGSLEGVSKNYVACNSYRRKCKVVEFAETELTGMANPRFIYGGEEAYSEAASHILGVTESATVKERVLRPLSQGVLVKLVLSKESPLYGEQPFCEDHFNVRRAVCFASLMVSGKSGLDFVNILASEIRTLNGGLLINLDSKDGAKATVETTLDALKNFAEASRNLIKQLGANAVYLTDGTKGGQKNSTCLSDAIKKICDFIDGMNGEASGDDANKGKKIALEVGGTTGEAAIGPYCRAFYDYCTTALSRKYVFAGSFEKEQTALTLTTNAEVDLPKFITNTNLLRTAETLTLMQKGEAIVEACSTLSITNDQVVEPEKNSLGIALRDDAFRNLFKAFFNRDVRAAQLEYQRVQRLFKKHKDSLQAASLVYWFIHVNDNAPISDDWNFLFRVLNRESSDSLQSASKHYTLTRSYIDDFMKDTKTRKEMDEVAAMVKAAVDEYYEVWTLSPDGEAFRGCTFMEHTAAGATYYPAALMHEYRDEPLYLASLMPSLTGKLVSGDAKFTPTTVMSFDTNQDLERYEASPLKRYIPPVAHESAIIPWLDRDPFRLESRSPSADRFTLIGDTADLDDYIDQLSHFIVDVSQASIECTSLQGVYCIRQSSGIGGDFKYLGQPSGKQYGAECTLDFVEKKDLKDCDKLLITSLDNHKRDNKREDYTSFVERRFQALRRVKIAEQPRMAPRIKQINEIRSEKLSQTRYEPSYATKNAVQSELLKVACSKALSAGGYIAGRRVAYRATMRPVFVTGIKKQDLSDELCIRLEKKGYYYTPFRAGSFIDAMFIDMTKTKDLADKYGDVVFIGFLSLVGSSTSNCEVKGDHVKTRTPEGWPTGVFGRDVEILSGIDIADRHPMYDKYIYTTQMVGGALLDGRPDRHFFAYSHFIDSSCLPSAALSEGAVAQAADPWLAMAAGVSTDYALGAFLALLGQRSTRKDSASSSVRIFNPVRALIRLASFIDYFYSMFGLYISYDGTDDEASKNDAANQSGGRANGDNGDTTLGTDGVAAPEANNMVDDKNKAEKDEQRGGRKDSDKGKQKDKLSGHKALTVLGRDGIKAEEAVRMVDFFLGRGSASFSLLKFQELILSMLEACASTINTPEVKAAISSFITNGGDRAIRATEARPTRCCTAAPSAFVEKMEAYTLLADAVDACDAAVDSFYSLDTAAMQAAIGLCVLNKQKPSIAECEQAVRLVIEAIDAKAFAAWYSIEDRYKPISCTMLGAQLLPSLYKKCASLVAVDSQVSTVTIERFGLEYAKEGPASFISRLLLLEARAMARNWHFYADLEDFAEFKKLCKYISLAKEPCYVQVSGVLNKMLPMVGISEKDTQ